MAWRGEGCLGKAADDEPVFVLRGQDKLAAQLVWDWAQRAREVGCPEQKVKEAEDLAVAMGKWSPSKFPD